MQQVDNFSSPRRGQVADRALHALEVLADTTGGLTVSELGRRLGVDKSTAHRLLATMSKRGFARLNPSTQRYMLGLRLATLGALAARSIDLTEIARPYLESVRDQTGEAASLAVLSETEALFLARVPAPGVLTVDQGVGTRMPLHCSAVGKVLSAALDPPAALEEAIKQQGLPRFTPRTRTDPADLLRHLEHVAAQGWALDDEEYTSGLRCLAAPIRDAHETVVAAIGIAGPASRVTLERIDELAATARRAGQDISIAMGWRPKAHSPIIPEANPAADDEA